MLIETPKGKLSIISPGSPMPETLEGHGFIIDKPIFWSSFDVIRFLKWSTKIRKIGHAGTLDPLATGVLVCLVGRLATKHAEYLTGQSKTYLAQVKLGETTASFDSESESTGQYDFDHITEDFAREASSSFEGEYLQTPPMYSAKKVGGERLYKKARRGEEVEREARPVQIDICTLLRSDLPLVELEIDCSKGTYIRCIADDFGKRLDSGAHLSGLRRTRSGNFNIDDSWKIEELANALGVDFSQFIKPRRLRDMEA